MKKIAIICAMQEELDAIIDILPCKYVKQIDNKITDYTIYEYKNLQIAMVLCGIGKVNAATITQMVICGFMPDYVINVGVAGCITDDLDFGDIVLAKDLVQHDVDATMFGLPKGQIPRMDVFSFSCDDSLLKNAISVANRLSIKFAVGRIVTGDQFIDNEEQAIELNSQFGGLACEMEGAAIAQVCYLNGIPFLVIRSLSDKAGKSGSASHSFQELKLLSAKNASNMLWSLLELIS